ncbi:MAG: rubredoxin [Succinivibrio sp.]|nr:rubredoxin [Succinivibrio sp.]
MQIKVVKLYEKGFMTQPFAMGGEEGQDKFDKNVKYRSSLQNYVIDTGDEVILVDTGMPENTPEFKADPDSTIYIGSKIKNYLDALAEVGYKPSQISKILVTHKHEDHTGMLAAFPKAKVYIGREDADAMNLTGGNIVRADFSDGPYYNFPHSQKIAEGVYFIKACGHTRGNSLIMAEKDGLFFMFHGDITYTDEALYANKLSIVYEDQAAARETLNQVRTFIQNHPTVYLSTHTPLGYENLEALRVVDLNRPTETLPLDEIVYTTASGKYVCSVCGYVYDPDLGDSTQNVDPGTSFADLPADWRCPLCRQGKDKFNPA